MKEARTFEYNETKDSQGITIIRTNANSFSFFDLFDPISIKEGDIVSIEGFLEMRIDHTRPFVMFVGSDGKRVVKRYVNLIDYNKSRYNCPLGFVRVTGEIIKEKEGIGDMKTLEIECLNLNENISKIVNSHWEDFGGKIRIESNSTKIDGGASTSLITSKTNEMIIFRNVGIMEKGGLGDYDYQVKVDVYYTVSLEGVINKIYVVYQNT